MELAILITTQGFVHIFEEIINQMDSKSLFEARLACKDWWKVIENHPKGLRQIIRRIRIQEAITNPDFRGITNGVEAKKGLKELCLVLRRFSEDRPPIGFLNPRSVYAHYYPGLNLPDSKFFELVFCDLKRLQYFWPYLPNKNPVFICGSNLNSTLHILAKRGHVETFQFIAERLDEVTHYRSMSVKDQIYIASRNRSFGIMVQITIEDKLQNPI